MTATVCKYVVVKVHFLLQYKQNETIHIVQQVRIPMYIHISLKCPNMIPLDASSDLCFGVIVDNFAVM